MAAMDSTSTLADDDLVFRGRRNGRIRYQVPPSMAKKHLEVALHGHKSIQTRLGPDAFEYGLLSEFHLGKDTDSRVIH
jgi:hypothetical protein